MYNLTRMWGMIRVIPRIHYRIRIMVNDANQVFKPNRCRIIDKW